MKKGSIVLRSAFVVLFLIFAVNMVVMLNGLAIVKNGVEDSNGIAIKDTFSDTEFQRYVSDKIDGNLDRKSKDGYLSEDEISNVKEINVDNYRNIYNFEGIGIFHNLEHFTANNTVASEIDLSQLPNLELVSIIGSSNIEKIAFYSGAEVDKNKALKVYLNGNKNLKNIDLKGLKNLTHLEINGSSIENLDLSNNNNLIDFRADGANGIGIALGISQAKGILNELTLPYENSKLQYMCISNNPEIKINNLSKQVNLKVLKAQNCGLHDADVPLNDLPELEEVYLPNNKLTNIAFTNNAKIKDMDLSFNELKKVDVASCKALKYFDVSHNHLIKLDTTLNENIKTFAADQQTVEIEAVNTVGMCTVDVKDIVEGKDPNMFNFNLNGMALEVQDGHIIREECIPDGSVIEYECNTANGTSRTMLVSLTVRH